MWGRKVYRLSWIVLGGLPFVGFYMAVFQADHIVGPDRIAFFLGGAGLILVLDSALTLLRYLRANPQPTRTQP